MTTATANPVAGETVSPATKTYANDGSFESVKNMLQLMAGKFTRRVEALGLPMSYDDVFQELCLSYVHAKKAWKPEGGAKFITYCVYAAQNNFNLAIKKMARDRVEMGMNPIEAYSHNGEKEDDPHEWITTSECEVSSSPDYRLERAASIMEASFGMSKTGKRVIAELLKNEFGLMGKKVKLSEIAQNLGIEGQELTRLKTEFRERFGVTWR